MNQADDINAFDENALDLIRPIADRAAERLRLAQSYPGPDGLCCCKVCRQPLEACVPDGTGKTLRLPVPCRCEAAKQREIEAVRLRAEAVSKCKGSPFYTEEYNRYTFAADDAPESKVSVQCRRYVQHWDEALKHHYGLMLLGPVGTGKTYYGACIANALKDRGVPALLVTVNRLVHTPSRSDAPQKLTDELNRFPLVVLDDFHLSDMSSYAVSVLEGFINVRAEAKKPLIITSNLEPKAFDARHETMAEERIFSRLNELCCAQLALVGESRRVASASARRHNLAALLNGGAA